MSRIVLPVVGVVLVLLAVAGVLVGLSVQQPGPVSAEGEGGPDLPPASAPVDAIEADGASLIRFGVPEAPAKRQGTIRLATYNVENLFDEIDDPALSGRNEDIDDAKPAAELDAAAETIRRLDADVLALQEIESEAVIRWFRESYLADLGYEHLASVDAGDERGIEQAVLSRFPITSVENWPGRDLGGSHPPNWGDAENYNAGEPIRFHRSPLRVVVEVPGAGAEEPYELTLYVVHAKSGRPGEYWRKAEAAGLAEIVAEQAASSPGANIAILGDFNAFLSDESVQTLVGAGFTDAMDDVSQGGPRFVSHESGRRIDHILVNPNLAAEVVPGSGFILGTPALPEGMDWRDEWRPEGYASDHYPVAVDIRPVE